MDVDLVSNIDSLINLPMYRYGMNKTMRTAILQDKENNEVRIYSTGNKVVYNEGNGLKEDFEGNLQDILYMYHRLGYNLKESISEVKA